MNQIIGNAIPIPIGRRTYFVSFVSMAEWETFSEFAEKKGLEALTYLISCSLRRADANITNKNIQKLIKKHPRKMTHLVDVICKLSLPRTKSKSKDEPKIEKKENERCMKILYRILSRLHGWNPKIISEMSPAQIFSYIMGGSTGTGIEKMSGPEYQALRRSMALVEN